MRSVPIYINVFPFWQWTSLTVYIYVGLDFLRNNVSDKELERSPLFLVAIMSSQFINEVSNKAVVNYGDPFSYFSMTE